MIPPKEVAEFALGVLDAGMLVADHYLFLIFVEPVSVAFCSILIFA
jgi:hypothetical protein